MNNLLFSILKGKSVVIVGPSIHLVGKNGGAEIDSYDVVVRVGELYPIGAENDYGRRTDVFVNSLNFHAPSQINFEIQRMKRENINIIKQIKCVICPQQILDDAGTNTIDNFRSIKEFDDIPICHIGDEQYWTIRKEIGTKPNTGMMVIPILLKYNVKKLFITGYSFYSQGNFSNCCYRGGYVGITDPMNPTGHSQPPQIEYFRKLLRENENIKIDFYLRTLLDV
jgi:hypothetical protein